MERDGEAAAAATASQSSQCSGVLDLSCTYNISPYLLQHEPPAGTWEEESSYACTSASVNNTASRTSYCEDNEKIRRDDDEMSALPSSISSSIDGEQSICTGTSSPQLETSEDIDDAQIRANLDAFYELSSQPGDDEFSQLLTEKILELKQKNHLYALRSFQMAKIILQEGTEILRNYTTDNVFSSTKETPNIKPVPGLSDDVVRFLLERKSTN